MALDSDRPSPTKLAAVQNAISQVKFILDRIDAWWPKKTECPSIEQFCSPESCETIHSWRGFDSRTLAFSRGLELCAVPQVAWRHFAV